MGGCLRAKIVRDRLAGGESGDAGPWMSASGIIRCACLGGRDAALRFLICTEFALRVRSRQVEGAQLAGLLTLARPAAGMRRSCATSGEGTPPFAPARGHLDPCELIKVAEHVAPLFVGPRIQPRVALGLTHQTNEVVVRVERTEKADSFFKRVHCQEPLLTDESTREMQSPVVPPVGVQFATDVDGNDTGELTLLAEVWLIVNMDRGSVSNANGWFPSLYRALDLCLILGTAQRGDGKHRT